MSIGSPLLLYARWQLREALGKALVPVLLFAGIGGIPLWTIHRQGAAGGMGAADLERADMAIYGATMPLVMTLGAVLLANALVSTDREKQHFRFLFSRPVAAWRFYLQQFVLSVLLFVACFTVIPVGFGLLVTPVPVFAALQSAALYALLIGSLAFLCSVLVNKDGVLLVVVALFSVTLQQAERAAALPRWAALLADALPPFVAADTVRSRWLDGRAADTGDLTLVLLYAAGMLMVSLFLLRRTPLAR